MCAVFLFHAPPRSSGHLNQRCVTHKFPSLAVLSDEESNGAEPPSCSLYMKELQTFIARAVDDYLAAFSCKPLITARLVELTAGRGTVDR